MEIVGPIANRKLRVWDSKYVVILVQVPTGHMVRACNMLILLLNCPINYLKSISAKFLHVGAKRGRGLGPATIFLNFGTPLQSIL